MSLATIKSYPSGISLHLDKDADFEDVIKEVEEKFEESRKFFKNAKVALSIEDRRISDEEEKRIVQAINNHSDVDLICIVGRNEETNRKFVKALKRVETMQDENNARFYKGDLLEGDIVESEGSLVIFGDVKEGSAAVAKNNVIVFGSIYGQAYAGNGMDKNCFIFCFGLDAKAISICNVKQAVKSTSKAFGKKKFTGTFVYLENDRLVAKQASEDAIRDLMNRNAETV